MRLKRLLLRAGRSGCRWGRSWIFPMNPYFHIDAIVPGMTFGGQVKLFLLLAAVISIFGKLFSITTLQVKRIYPAIKHPEYVKMLYLLFIAFLISMAEFNLTGGGEQFLLSQAMHGYTYSLDCRYDAITFGF